MVKWGGDIVSIGREEELGMRRFWSYGPVNSKLHYYAPREELVDRAYGSLVGDNPDEGGHYITVWAPRQTGKSWLMQQKPRFDVLKINLEVPSGIYSTAGWMRSSAPPSTAERVHYS